METENTNIEIETDLNTFAAEEDHLADCDRAVEQMIQWSKETYGEQELTTGKDEFFWKTGKVFPEDHHYDQRMVYFLDYFLFARPVPQQFAEGKSLTAFEDYLHQKNDSQEFILTDARHCVCEVGRTTKKGVVFRDLITGEKMVISARHGHNFRWLTKGSLVQGFLYESADHIWLSHGAIYHPTDAKSVIKKSLTKAKKAAQFEPERELARLARQHLRHLRHRNVAAKTIYSQDTW